MITSMSEILKISRSRNTALLRLIPYKVQYKRFLLNRLDPTTQNSTPKSLEQELPRKLKELMKAKEKLKEDSKISIRKQKTLAKSKYGTASRLHAGLCANCNRFCCPSYPYKLSSQ